jgi:hypothetical protein
MVSVKVIGLALWLSVVPLCKAQASDKAPSASQPRNGANDYVGMTFSLIGRDACVLITVKQNNKERKIMWTIQ